MSQIGTLRRGATQEQKDAAAEVAAILLSKGFEQDHLEDPIYRIAQNLGDRKGRTDAERNKYVNIELSAADELNGLAMEDQLVVMAAYHETIPAFRAAVEEALRTSLTATVAPLPALEKVNALVDGQGGAM